MGNQHQKEAYYMTKFEIENKLKKKYGHADIELISWSTTREPVVFKCLRCQAETKIARLDGLFDKRRKNLCPKCRKAPLRQAGTELQEKFNVWYQNTGKDKYDLNLGFTTVNNKVELTCKKCGTFQKRGVKLLLEDDRCLSCEKKVNLKKTNDQIDKDLKEKMGEEYIRLEDYVNADTPILFKHSICGKCFKMSPHRLLSDRGRCPCYQKESKGEQAIQAVLEENKIPYVPQYRIENMMKAPFDFYLPDYNLLIEYQGIQHSQPVDFFGGQKQFLRQQEIDSYKKELALQQGYQIIYIDYTEKDNLKEILVQRLSSYGVHSSGWKEQTSEISDDDIV